MDHEQIRDDLAAYALGALPDREAMELEGHLRECGSCRERLRWLRPALDLLPVSVEQREPAPELRDRLMATVRAEAAAEGVAPQREPARSTARRWWHFQLPSVRPAMAAAAACLVLLAGGAIGFALGEGGTETVAPQSTFTKADPIDASRVSATLEQHGDSATLHVDELPPLRPDQVYEVWVDRNGNMEPSTLFVVDRRQRGSAAIPGPLAGADRILVTAEPRGGSETPTGNALLTAEL
jgi:anti-sigma-K factor RskA